MNDHRPVGEPTFRVEAVDPTEDQHLVNLWAQQAVEQRVPRIRALAERWTATLGTLIGLLGGASVLNADDEIRALAGPWRGLYGIGTLVAIVLAALATFLGMQAAGERLFDMPPDVGGRAREHDRTFERARRLLTWSQIAAMGALSVLVLSFAVRWYAPLAAQ